MAASKDTFTGTETLTPFSGVAVRVVFLTRLLCLKITGDAIDIDVT
jgi:hypothetical protein